MLRSMHIPKVKQEDSLHFVQLLAGHFPWDLSLSRLVGYSDGLDLGNRDSLFFPESEASYRGREGMKAPLFPLSQATGLGGHACPYGVLR